MRAKPEMAFSNACKTGNGCRPVESKLLRDFREPRRPEGDAAHVQGAVRVEVAVPRVVR
jgi:hypothetical protein